VSEGVDLTRTWTGLEALARMSQSPAIHDECVDRIVGSKLTQRLIQSIATRAARRLKSELEDLRQEAWIGALKGIRSWDPEKGRLSTCLSVYAQNQISHSIDRITGRSKISRYGRRRYAPLPATEVEIERRAGFDESSSPEDAATARQAWRAWLEALRLEALQVAFDSTGQCLDHLWISRALTLANAIVIRTKFDEKRPREEQIYPYRSIGAQLGVSHETARKWIVAVQRGVKARLTGPKKIDDHPATKKSIEHLTGPGHLDISRSCTTH
jgi:hypothetical protein